MVMFDFLRRPGRWSLSPAIRRARGAAGLPPGADLAVLGAVESPGTYAGRRVIYFRVFDPQRAADRAVDVFPTSSSAGQARNVMTQSDVPCLVAPARTGGRHLRRA